MLSQQNSRITLDLFILKEKSVHVSTWKKAPKKKYIHTYCKKPLKRTKPNMQHLKSISISVKKWIYLSVVIKILEWLVCFDINLQPFTWWQSSISQLHFFYTFSSIIWKRTFYFTVFTKISAMTGWKQCAEKLNIHHSKFMIWFSTIKLINCYLWMYSRIHCLFVWSHI